MANHVVFLVHGMGNFEKDWSNALVAQLRGHFNAYEELKFNATEKTFDFEEITYNTVFEDWKRQWKDDAAAAAKAAAGLGMESAVVDSLLQAAAAPAGDGFFQTHLLDVALFYSFEIVAEQVQRHVAEQILRRLRAKGQNNIPRWSVIAHSLGTAVMGETLHAMFSHRIEGEPLGDAFKPQCVAMLANTGRLLWNKGGDLYLSKTRPDGPDGSGACWRYLDFRHALDPVPAVQPFHKPPPQWFPAGVDPKEVYVHVDLPAADLQSRNVHAFEHYLGHPDVHIPLITSLVKSKKVITAAERDAALKAWRDASLPNQAKQKAMQELSQLVGKENDPFTQAFANWLLYRTKIGRELIADGETR